MAHSHSPESISRSKLHSITFIRYAKGEKPAIGSFYIWSVAAILKTWKSWGVPPLGISMFPSTLLSQTTLVGQVYRTLED